MFCAFFLLFFLSRREVTTASLNCWRTNPDNSDLFTIRQIFAKALSHLSMFSTKWSGWDWEHSLWGQNHACEQTLVTLAQSHKVYCPQKSEVWEYHQQVVDQVHCEQMQSFSQSKNRKSASSHSGIIMYSIMCYLTKLEHTAHYREPKHSQNKLLQAWECAHIRTYTHSQ